MSNTNRSQNMTDLERAAANLRAACDRIFRLDVSPELVSEKQRCYDEIVKATRATEAAARAERENLRLRQELEDLRNRAGGSLAGGSSAAVSRREDYVVDMV